MMSKILDGHLVANYIKERLKTKIAKLKNRPRLAVCLVGADEGSHVYVAGKQRACASVGIDSELKVFSERASNYDVIDWLKSQNHDPSVSGILVQLPLPQGFDRNAILRHINPTKDVDCFHPENRGLLDLGEPRFLPCTPAGIIEILKYYKIPIKGSHVVIVNRSIVVGQPLATMLTQNTEYGNATVTLCHEHTKNINEICRSADIVITAVGKRPDFILTGNMVKYGVVVIDVGITREGKRIVGDCDFETVSGKAGFITPVPGGMGPVTISMLLQNTVNACERTV